MIVEMDDEIIEKIVDTVLERISGFCALNDNCERCPYMIKPAPGKSFATCALFGRPEHWRLDVLRR